MRKNMPLTQTNTQVEFLEAILQRAKSKYDCASDKSIYPLDPQGRVIIEVDVANKFSNLKPAPTKTILVSLDVNGDNDSLIGKLTEKLNKVPQSNQTDDIIEKYKLLAKSRIISLQQETYFHAYLIGRMLEKACEISNVNIEPNKFNEGINNALQVLNGQVLDLQAQALRIAYKKTSKKQPFDQELFAVTFNAALDAARKILLPSIAKILREELIKKTKITFNDNITQHLSKNLAEETAATKHDFVFEDQSMGMVSYIGASEHTSHHRGLGDANLADRLIYSHHITQQKTVQELSDRQQIRVPSLPIKELHKETLKFLKKWLKNRELKFEGEGGEKGEVGNQISAMQKIFNNNNYTVDQEFNQLAIVDQAFNQLAIQDTAEKIKHIQTKYELSEGSRDTKNPLPKAFVYNLYTTLNRESSFIESRDEKTNLQSQSAEHILKAAHRYNRENTGKPLCLVQNIPVNGFGYTVSIDDKKPDLVNEAAVMMYMATLHTVYDVLNEDSKTKVQLLFKEYNTFLNEIKEDAFFYNYLKNAGKLGFFNDKNNLVIYSDETKLLTLKNHAKNALLKLFNQEDFSNHDYGFTYQALSVFAEDASMGSCKSANERTQAVNGRVAILDFICLGKNSRDALLKNTGQETLIIAAADELEKLIKNPGFETKEINERLNFLYQHLNLEGFQAVISFIDQGGHAKLGTKGIIPNTNNCEQVVTHVKNASQWQCHKGLISSVLKEFCGVENISLGKEFKNLGNLNGLLAGGVGGALTGTGLFFLAAVIGLSAAFPPLGMAIGLGVFIGAGVVSAVAVGNYAYKLWNAEAQKQERFEAIVNENIKLVDSESLDDKSNTSLLHSSVDTPDVTQKKSSNELHFFNDSQQPASPESLSSQDNKTQEAFNRQNN